MKITAGKAKGRGLKLGKGLPLRPTTSLVRQAIFSILNSLDSWDWQRVLDLYAGSGALGIEALSRGAEWVDFVEINHRCAEVIKTNLAKSGFVSQAKVYCCSVNKALSFLKDEYDLVLLDPPYNFPFPVDCLEKLSYHNLIGANSTIVTQYSPFQSLPASFGQFQLARARSYGDSQISIYQLRVES
jgi:16S rRNA (guanine(966)-N(2))-methyltransferase RsmD